MAYNNLHFICAGFCGSALWAGQGGSSAGLGCDHSATLVGWWVAWGLSENESLLLVVLSSIGYLGFFAWQSHILQGLLLSLALLRSEAQGPSGADSGMYAVLGTISRK